MTREWLKQAPRTMTHEGKCLYFTLFIALEIDCNCIVHNFPGTKAKHHLLLYLSTRLNGRIMWWNIALFWVMLVLNLHLGLLHGVSPADAGLPPRLITQTGAIKEGEASCTELWIHWVIPNNMTGQQCLNPTTAGADLQRHLTSVVKAQETCWDLSVCLSIYLSTHTVAMLQ